LNDFIAQNACRQVWLHEISLVVLEEKLIKETFMTDRQQNWSIITGAKDNHLCGYFPDFSRYPVYN